MLTHRPCNEDKELRNLEIKRKRKIISNDWVNSGHKYSVIKLQLNMNASISASVKTSSEILMYAIS